MLPQYTPYAVSREESNSPTRLNIEKMEILKDKIERWNGRIGRMKSIWSITANHFKAEKPKEKKAEGIVIGAGMAGVLTAYFLKQAGISVMILEANGVGSGQTKNTTAKVTAQHGDIYHKLIENFGWEKARQYADANRIALDQYKRLIKDLCIECNFEIMPSYLYSLKEEEILEKEAICSRNLGLDTFYTTKTTLPFTVKSAVKMERQAQFHPLRFLYTLADNLPVYEHTKVIKIKDKKIWTDQGEFYGDKIIFTSHYPFLNFPGLYFTKIHQERSYLSAWKTDYPLDGMYYGIDEDGLSFRKFQNMLLIGGASHRTGENTSGGNYDRLKQAGKTYFPTSSLQMLWSAQDCITLDEIPYIGKYSRLYSNWYVATGFKKWGMSFSMIAARLLSDQIMGVPNPYASIFSPQRFSLKAEKEKIKEGCYSIKNLWKEFMTVPKNVFESLAPGQGGVVRYQGKKVGAFKDKNGEVYLVSTKCPHLGCQMAWNPEELTWDCPCHGSRFDYKGNLLNNPSKKSISWRGEKELINGGKDR